MNQYAFVGEQVPLRALHLKRIKCFEYLGFIFGIYDSIHNRNILPFLKTNLMMIKMNSS